MAVTTGPRAPGDTVTIEASDWNALISAVEVGVYLPSQSVFPESLAIGPGLRNLTNLSGDNGKYNTVTGYRCGLAITTGEANTLYGRVNGELVTTGNFNTAVGVNTLAALTDGTGNTAVGYGCLFVNVHGNGNTCLGQTAGKYTMGDVGVFLGHAAGYWETQGSCLYIDNTARTDEADGRVKALVYGVFGTNPVDQSLTVNGIFRQSGASTYSVFSQSGTAGLMYFGSDATCYFSRASGLFTVATQNEPMRLYATGYRLAGLAAKTSDPHVVDELWNSGGTVKVSAG